jgi:hypothetical protein
MILREIGGELVHELGTDDISNVDGDSNYVRVQVLTNASVLTREKQLATVEQLTATRRSSHSAGRATIHRRAWERPDRGGGCVARVHGFSAGSRDGVDPERSRGDEPHPALSV